MNPARAKQIVDEALAIEAEEATAAGALGYTARLLAQCTMPHAQTDEPYFERTNGAVTVAIQSAPKIGLPFGTYPRLLLVWMTTEAVRTKSADLDLGNSLSAFMRTLELDVTGGKKGTIRAFHHQTRRFLSAGFSWTYSANKAELGLRLFPVEKSALWWDPQSPTQDNLLHSSISLNRRFFEEIIASPVPVDMRAIKLLAKERSPMALDIYTWITHRVSYLRKDQNIPWEALELQFGGSYGRTVDFKRKFVERLKLVNTLYRNLRVTPSAEGLTLHPSPSHIPLRAVRGQLEM